MTTLLLNEIYYHHCTLLKTGCPDGYRGNDCLILCDAGLYGYRCAYK